MPEIVKVSRQRMPALRLIGKRYGDADRGRDGGFGHKWNEWFQNGWFGVLEALGSLPENEGAYLGCMSFAGGFSYWIGTFFPENTPVPDGFAYADIPAGDVGLCWIYGNRDNGELFGRGAHDMCAEKIKEAGWEFEGDFANGLWPWFFERYQSPRFTVPDAQGNVILDYGIYIKPEPHGGNTELSPEAERLVDALHQAALANGCKFHVEENEYGRTITYSVRNLSVKGYGGKVSFSGEFDIRTFLRLYRETNDNTIKKLLFGTAAPCCYCIDDKCTTLLMAQERTIECGGQTKKLCGPYRHSLAIEVTEETLPSCLAIMGMMFQYTYPYMHKDPVARPDAVTYKLTEREDFYILGYKQRHSPISPSDEEFIASLLRKDSSGKSRADGLWEAAGRAQVGPYVGATDNFTNGASYDFIFGVLTDKKPETITEGAICRKVNGGQWAVYNSSTGDYKGIWQHFTERFYPLERKGFDGSRIPFEFYDENGRFFDVHIPVDSDLPADSGQVLQAIHTANELLVGYRNYAETDYPLYEDRPFDMLERVTEQFPHAQCLVRVSIHSLFGKPLMGFDGVPVDDLSVIPEGFETYEMKGGYWRRLGWKHFNGGYQGWGEAIGGNVTSAPSLNTMHHPRGFNEYVYAARGGYSEIGVPMRLMGKQSFEFVELAPMAIAGKREAPPHSVVTEEEARRFCDMPENAVKGSYIIGYTLACVKPPFNQDAMTFFDKPFVQGIETKPGAPVPEGLEVFTLDGGPYVKVTEDIPNGVLGWELGGILGGVRKETGREHDGSRQFIYHQLDYGKRYELYVPVR